VVADIPTGKNAIIGHKMIILNIIMSSKIKIPLMMIVIEV